MIITGHSKYRIREKEQRFNKAITMKSKRIQTKPRKRKRVLKLTDQTQKQSAEVAPEMQQTNVEQR